MAASLILSACGQSSFELPQDDAERGVFCVVAIARLAPSVENPELSSRLNDAARNAEREARAAYPGSAASQTTGSYEEYLISMIARTTFEDQDEMRAILSSCIDEYA